MSSEKLQPCLQRRVFGEWVEDLWSRPGRYTLQEPPNSWKTEQSLSWFSHSPRVFEPITFEWHHWIFSAAEGHGFDPRLTWVARAARVFSVSLTKVRPAPEIATFSSCSYGWHFCAKEAFMRKLTKQISFELFSRWIIYTEADGLLSKLKKKNSTASGLSLYISCHLVMWVAVLAWGLTAAHRCPFHSQAENDKFNKLKTPLQSTYGSQRTWQAAEGLLPSRPDTRCWHSISISREPRNNFPSH